MEFMLPVQSSSPFIIYLRIQIYQESVLCLLRTNLLDVQKIKIDVTLAESSRVSTVFGPFPNQNFAMSA
jgi:hypothetical protein